MSNFNDETMKTPMDESTINSSNNPIGMIPKEKSNRLRFIDMARGFTMLFLLVTTAFPPDPWKDRTKYPVLWLLSAHPGYYDIALTIYDIGTPAFLFIIGLSLAFSYRKHVEKEGTKKELLRLILRFGLLMILGELIIFADGQKFTNIKTFDPNSIIYPQFHGLQLNVVIWDVIPAIALTGLASIPFILIKNDKIRLTLAYAWMLTYGILFWFTDLRAYAILSIHGGIFGTLFTFVGVMVVASVLGDYMFYSKTPDKQKYTNILIFGVINLVVGFLVAMIPGWEAVKHQGSFTYGLISIGVSTLALMIFVYLDKGLNIQSRYLEALGRNPFFIYFLVEVPSFVLKELIDLNTDQQKIIFSLIYLPVLLVYVSSIMWYLYKKNKIISTEKATLIFIIVAVILAAILLGFGLI